MQRRFVTCFRDIATLIIAVSRSFHSSNQNVFLCGTKLVVYHKHKQMFVWKLNNGYWRCNSEVLVESWAYIRSELLTQWNAGCKTLNNDHYQYTYYQRLFCFSCSSPLWFDYIIFRLALAISCKDNFHMWRVVLIKLNSSDIILSETLS